MPDKKIQTPAQRAEYKDNAPEQAMVAQQGAYFSIQHRFIPVVVDVASITKDLLKSTSAMVHWTQSCDQWVSVMVLSVLPL